MYLQTYSYMDNCQIRSSQMKQPQQNKPHSLFFNKQESQQSYIRRIHHLDTLDSRVQDSGLNNIPVLKGFDLVVQIERQIKEMVECYFLLVEKIGKNSKAKDEQIDKMALQFYKKYEITMQTIDSLPLHSDKPISVYEGEVLQKHRDAVQNFKKTIERAMTWKKQMHSIINNHLFTRNLHQKNI